MKVIIDDKPNTFISIIQHGNHWQCNTEGNASAHNFNMHPKHYEKDRKIKTNGHVYVFPSK